MPGKSGYEVARTCASSPQARAHSGRAVDRRIRAGRIRRAPTTQAATACSLSRSSRKQVIGRVKELLGRPQRTTTSGLHRSVVGSRRCRFRAAAASRSQSTYFDRLDSAFSAPALELPASGRHAGRGAPAPQAASRERDSTGSAIVAQNDRNGARRIQRGTSGSGSSDLAVDRIHRRKPRRLRR